MQVAPKLVTFAIFDPSLTGNEESMEAQYRQILLFYPPNLPKQIQIKQVGIQSALYNFNQTFSTTDTIITTTKKQKSILRKQGGVFILIKIRLGANLLVKDSKKYAVYNDLSDSAIKLILQDCIDRFKLFHSGFDELRQKCAGTNEFKDILEYFFPCYLETINLGQIDLINSVRGIEYAQFNQELDRKAVSCITRLISRFPQFSSSMLLYKEMLIWSGMESYQDTKLVYEYLIHPETGKYDDLIINQVKVKGEAVISKRQDSKFYIQNQNLTKKDMKHYKFTGFLVGPLSSDLESDEYSPKIVYLDGIPHVLLVFQFQDNITIALLSKEIENSDLKSSIFYHHLNANLLDVLQDLDHHISLNYRFTVSDNPYHFIQIESLTFAIKTSHKSKKGPLLNLDLINDLAGLYTSTIENQDTNTVILQKTKTFLCCFKSKDAVILLVVSKDDSTIRSVQDEITKFKSFIEGQ